jgi:hypothetical protein
MHGRDAARRRLGAGRHARPGPLPRHAEQHALDFIAWRAPECRTWFDYMCALPEGEKPEE